MKTKITVSALLVIIGWYGWVAAQPPNTYYMSAGLPPADAVVPSDPVLSIGDDWARNVLISPGPVIVAWDSGSPEGIIETYEIIVTRLFRTTTEVVTYTTAETQFTIPRLRTGFWDVKVRAVSSGLYSDWTVASAAGMPEPWIIYFDIPAPGGGGIE